MTSFLFSEFFKIGFQSVVIILSENTILYEENAFQTSIYPVKREFTLL